MKLDSFLNFFSYAWKEILIGFVSTVLGIAVTIGVDKKLEEDQAEEDKRNLTIMIIHDLDESEQRMQRLVDTYREYYEQSDYVMKHLDQVSEISEDTLTAALQILSIDMESDQLKFPQMAENVLTNNMSNWTTLNNVKFMSNAEICFANRKMFNETIVSQDVSKPVQKLYRDFYDRYQEEDMDWDEIRKEVLKIYATPEVRLYVQNFEWILSQRSHIISTLHQLNYENKWLMSVSSDDIEEYVKASSKRAPSDRPRVTRKSILGTWLTDSEHLKGTMRYAKSESITFSADNTYKIVRQADIYQEATDTTYTHTDMVYGHWKLKGNDLICVYDSTQFVIAPQYVNDKDFCKYFARQREKLVKEAASSRRAVMSDILIGDNEISTMLYPEGKEDKAHLVHYRRK